MTFKQGKFSKCLRNIYGMFKECLADVYGMFRGGLEAAMSFNASTLGPTHARKGCLRDVYRMFKECLTDV